MSVRIVPARLDAEGRRHIREAAELLERGGLVAFPTETVYGIGANAEDPAAMDRLRRVKQRPRGKSFTVHLGRREDVERHVERVPPIAGKLMDRYWPGPLTLVLPARGGGHVGLRMPSHPVAEELLRQAAVPVVAPSVNRSGQPPATTARQAAEALGEELDLILDGGSTSLQQASTVLRVAEDGAWDILREGVVTEARVRRTLATTIVFVCTANMCRSPMAEALCKQMLAERLGCQPEELPARGYVVLSAGVCAVADGPASAGAVAAMEERGLDLANHCTQPLTPSLLDDADVVFVMARQHAASLSAMFPEAEAKVRLLDPAGGDVGDPVGGSPELFRQCAARIERHLREVIDSL